MPTYKGGIPKLRFGTDLAPDPEPLGMPQYLSTFSEVEGKLERPKVDHLATLIAKRSSDNPARIADGDFAVDRVAPDGRTVRLVAETRFSEVAKIDRTLALGDEDTLPPWREGDTVPMDWTAHDEAVAIGRQIAREMLGDEAFEAFQAAKRARLAPRRQDKITTAHYACTEADFAAMDRRREVGNLLVVLGWPRNLAYDGTYT